MRAIVKQPEPPSLTAHRQNPHCDFDNYQDKDALRHALVSEQRGLCCYCMGRIRPKADKMKIEHWQCRSRHQDKQLDYRNLLGACRGGEGQGRHQQHCDTQKRDRDLLWNPADPAHMIEERIGYGSDGTVRSRDTGFNHQLNQILNLNLPFLKQHRKSVLDAILQWWKTRKPVPREQIEQEILRRASAAGSLTPYCPVAVWWLSQKLAQMTR